MVDMLLVPSWIRWVQYPDPLRYVFEMCCIAQWGENEWSKQIYENGIGYGFKFDYFSNFCSLVFLTIVFHGSAILILYLRSGKF